MTTVTLSLEELVTQNVQTTVRGSVPVVLGLSAYDIPISVDVNRDESGKQIHIRFNYMSRDEEIDEQRLDGLTVLVGRRSRKVFGFNVDPSKYAPEDISVRIVEGVEQQLCRATRDITKLNYRMIQSVVRTKLDDVLISAASTGP